LTRAISNEAAETCRHAEALEFMAHNPNLSALGAVHVLTRLAAINTDLRGLRILVLNEIEEPPLMTTGRPRFTLTFEALPGAVPVAARVKGLLKRALRSFNLRCTDARELPAVKTEQGNQPAGETIGLTSTIMPVLPEDEQHHGP
jgi:hypothetical protein